jgi:hypothetical protein
LRAKICAEAPKHVGAFVLQFNNFHIRTVLLLHLDIIKVLFIHQLTHW